MTTSLSEHSMNSSIIVITIMIMILFDYDNDHYLNHYQDNQHCRRYSGQCFVNIIHWHLINHHDNREREREMTIVPLTVLSLLSPANDPTID